MSKLLIPLRDPASLALVAAAVVAGCLLTTPAAAEGRTVYQWVTDEGTLAFTDDEKAIPTRYRDRVKQREMLGLTEYRRYTRIATPQRVPDRAPEPEPSRLQAFEAPPQRSAPGRGPTVSVRTGGANSQVIDVTPDANEAEPIVIEKRRYVAENGSVTRTNTIVRQGDRILTVIKPQANQTNITDFGDEDDL